jgi:hypothetical protein
LMDEWKEYANVDAIYFSSILTYEHYEVGLTLSTLKCVNNWRQYMYRLLIF